MARRDIDMTQSIEKHENVRGAGADLCVAMRGQGTAAPERGPRWPSKTVRGTPRGYACKENEQRGNRRFYAF